MQVSDYFEEIFDKQQGGFHKGYIPVDTRRKLNVHKTFRRRPGREICEISYQFLAVP